MYLVLSWKGLVVQLQNIHELYDKVTHAIKRLCETSPADYLVSERHEYNMDAAGVAQQRNKRFRIVTHLQVSTKSNVCLFGVWCLCDILTFVRGAIYKHLGHAEGAPQLQILAQPAGEEGDHQCETNASQEVRLCGRVE